MASVEDGLKLLGEIRSKDQRLCLETLIKILRNVVTNPEVERYRSLKVTNKRFFNDVWRHEGAKLILEAAGWVEAGDCVFLPSDTKPQHVGEALQILIENRTVTPAEDEWVDSTKVLVPNRAKIQEEELRRKALEQKSKEMARLKRDMAERKAIAQRVLQEHRDDMKRREAQKPALARPLGQGKTAKMDDFKNKGG